MNTDQLDEMERECPMDQTIKDRLGNNLREGDYVLYAALAQGFGKTTPVIRYARIIRISYDTAWRTSPWRITMRGIDDELDRMPPCANPMRHVVTGVTRFIKVLKKNLPEGYADLIADAEREFLSRKGVAA